MLIGAAIALLVFISLLAVPLSLSYQLCWRQAMTGSIRLQWLFGLVRIHLPLSRSTPSASTGEEDTGKKRVKKSSSRTSNPVAAIRSKPFRQRVFRFIRDLWHAIRKRDLILHIRIGLGDPADTGRLWAIIGPASGLLANIDEAAIAIEPEFIDAVFELDSSGSIRIIPLQLVYLILGLLLSPSLWRGLNQMRKET